MSMSGKIMAAAAALAAACCAFAAAGAQTEIGGQTITRFGTYESTLGSEDNYTGKVYINPIFDEKKSAPVKAAYVTFDPRARTFWHIHPLGEHLIITFGTGLTGTADGRVVEFWAGDEIWCPPGVRHWHGAAPNSGVTYIAVSPVKDGKTTEWQEEVTEEQYDPGEYISE